MNPVDLWYQLTYDTNWPLLRNYCINNWPPLTYWSYSWKANQEFTWLLYNHRTSSIYMFLCINFQRRTLFWGLHFFNQKFIYDIIHSYDEKIRLTDTGENVQKWTRVFSTRRWVVQYGSYSSLGRVGKREENSASTFGRFRL